jgi:hypothetical protein
MQLVKENYENEMKLKEGKVGPRGEIFVETAWVVVEKKKPPFRARMKHALQFKSKKDQFQETQKIPPIPGSQKYGQESAVKNMEDGSAGEELLDSDNNERECGTVGTSLSKGAKMQPPKEKEMLLKVSIRRARKLPVYDRLTMRANTYAIAILQNKEEILGRTNVKTNTLNPRWDFAFSIAKTPELMEEGVMRIEVRHVDNMGNEEVVGFFETRVNEIAEDIQKKYYELDFNPDHNDNDSHAGLVTNQPLVAPRVDTLVVSVLRLREVLSGANAAIMDHASSSKLLLTVSLSCP